MPTSSELFVGIDIDIISIILFDSQHLVGIVEKQKSN